MGGPIKPNQNVCIEWRGKGCKRKIRGSSLSSLSGPGLRVKMFEHMLAGSEKPKN